MDVIVLAGSLDWCKLLNRVSAAATWSEMARDRYARVASRKSKIYRNIVERFSRRHYKQIKWYYRSDMKDQIGWRFCWQVSDAKERAKEWTGYANRVSLLLDTCFNYPNDPTKIVVTGDDLKLLERIEQHAQQLGYTDSQ